MSTLLSIAPPDPADVGFPATLPLELAMREDTPKNICKAYGISKAEYDVLCANPYFVRAVEDAIAELQKDGVSFKIKARAQAGELLKTSFQLIHDGDTPPSVKADLIKFTIRSAGLDASIDQKNAGNAAPGVALQINLNLGD